MLIQQTALMNMLKTLGLACVIAVGTGSFAHAQTPEVADPAGAAATDAASETVQEDARAIFREAAAAFRDGRFAEAAEGFEHAHSVMPSAATLYNAARAWQEAKEDARAADAYSRALAMGGLPADHATDAQQQLDALRREVGLIDIKTALPATVSVGHRQKLPTPIRVFVGPGKHEIEISWEQSGKVETRTVAVEEGATYVLDLGQGETQTEIVMVEKPGPAPQPPGIYFYARAGLGFGAMSDSISNAPVVGLDVDPVTGSYGGPAGAVELLLGASLTPQFTVAVGIFNTTVSRDRIDYEQPKNDILEIKAGVVSMFGAMLDYNPSGNGGWHYYGAVGGSSLEFTNAQPRGTSPVPNPFGGFLLGGAGYDWWLADRWRLGLSGRIGGAAMTDGDEKHNVMIFSILGTATWDFRGRR